MLAVSIPKVGKIFQDRYLILDELGAGGMGLVFKAKQLDADREVALKLMRQEKILDEESVARFYREFKLLNRLSHPHVMLVYSLALDENKFPYAVCEYLEGKSLRQVISQSDSLPWQRAVKIASQIADAMRYIHEHGIIHRDLKPDNVILQDRPAPDFVKLVDFGLSSDFVSVSNEQKLTWTGQLVGSVAYMSPEQATGKADVRSDIYAFGCVLFEMLAGEPLFTADTTAGALFKHCNDDPHQRFQRIAKAPASLFDVLSRCLEKKPELRYQSMSELHEDLQPVLGEKQTLVKGSSYKKQAGSNAKWIGVVAALVVVVIGSVYVLCKLVGSGIAERTHTFSKKPPPRHYTQAEFDTVALAVSNARTASSVSLEQLEMMCDDLSAQIGKAATEKEKFALRSVQSKILVALARKEINMSQRDIASAALALARANMESAVPSTETRGFFLMLATMTKNPDEIENDLRRVVSFEETSPIKISGVFQMNLFAISRLISIGHYKSADKIIEKSIEQVRSIPNHENLMIALAFKSTVLKHLKNTEGSDKANKQLLELITAEHASSALLDQAQIAYEHGDFETTQLLLEDSIPLIEKQGEEGMRILPGCLYLLKTVHLAQHNKLAALADYDALLALFDKYGNIIGVPPKSVIVNEREALAS